jgi:hypothetical protein
MGISIEIKGVEELSKLLSQLPYEMREKHVRAAMVEASQYTVMAIKGRVPKDTGTLYASIQASRVKYYPSSGVLFCAIEPKSGFSRSFSAMPSSSGKTRRLSKKKATATAGAVKRNPRKYLHIIESGRKAVVPVTAKALHPAMSSRFFARASAVAGRPIFGPVASQMAPAFKVAVTYAVEKAVAEFNNSKTT